MLNQWRPNNGLHGSIARRTPEYLISRRHDGTAKDATTKTADDGRKPCVNCGKRHKIPDEKCWALEKNKNDRPNNYVKPPPGFAKGN